MPAIEFPLQDSPRGATAKGVAGPSTRSKEALSGDEEASFAHLLKRAAGEPGAALREDPFGGASRDRKAASERGAVEGEREIAPGETPERGAGQPGAGPETAEADGFQQLLLMSASPLPASNTTVISATETPVARAVPAQLASPDALLLRNASDGGAAAASVPAIDMPYDPIAIGMDKFTPTQEPDAGPVEQSRPLTASVVDRQTHFAPVQPSAASMAKAPTMETAAAVPSVAEAATVAPQMRPAANGRPALHVAGAGPAAIDDAGMPGSEADAAVDPVVPRRVAQSGDAIVTPQADEGVARPPVDQRDVAPADTDAPSKARTALSEPSVKPEKVQDATAARLANTAPRDTTAPAPGALPPVTMQRLAGTVLSAAAELGGPAVAAQSAAPTDPTSSAALKGPVRILELELTPVELGLVRVRMRMGASGIEMQVSAAKAETAELLKADLGRLAETIRDAGYDIDTVSIQTSGDGFRPQISSAARVDPGSSAFAGAGSQGSSEGGAGHNAREGSGRSGENAAGATYRKDDDAQTASDGERARRGSLFV
ncbi:flagellar hook-length control protein FliK [Amorphus sp. 3PC139-8]|uniref:flagellar hook-length control protein FliK n=1 Tax=Amorphus sp. 3PC139-8 TaxID=2735676 RepID=UPI00345C65E8